MKNIIIVVIWIAFSLSDVWSQTTYPNNEDGTYQDMLTPQYYLSANSDSLRNEINKYVHFARLEKFGHPLADVPYRIPANGRFGAGKGPTGTTEHHPAADMYVGNRETDVTIYAAHSGYAAVYRDVKKYRNHLSVTKDVEDDLGNVVGKIVTIYAHIDLDLDAADNVLPDGKYVNKGDIVSKHLYSETVGGPHLHFEIRFYRPGENGDEEFYSWVGPQGSDKFTEKSEGPWSYGFWDPNLGYGYGNPANHLPDTSTTVLELPAEDDLKVYPNPAADFIIVKLSATGKQFSKIRIINLFGEVVLQQAFMNDLYLKTEAINNGVYFVEINTGMRILSRRVIVNK
ncbi:MAG: T9SS type A sorting domain-containing protein [Chlorobi bacterium]|nr:T9SS type A sorting domain-containing protein [Chlorobiota bacterium]